MTAQVCPNGAKRTKHHKQRPMQRTNSIQLLDTNQRHCLFDNAATTNQAIFSAIFNSLLVLKKGFCGTFEMQGNVRKIAIINGECYSP